MSFFQLPTPIPSPFPNRRVYCFSCRAFSSSLRGAHWTGLIRARLPEDFVLLVMNPKGANSIMSSKVKLGADASAAAGPKGRTAAADTDIVLRAEVLTYFRSRGLFAGISLEGSTLRSDGSANRKLYGRDVSAKEIVRQGKVGTPRLWPRINLIVGQTVAQERVRSRIAEGISIFGRGDSSWPWKFAARTACAAPQEEPGRHCGTGSEKPHKTPDASGWFIKPPEVGDQCSEKNCFPNPDGNALRPTGSVSNRKPLRKTASPLRTHLP